MLVKPSDVNSRENQPRRIPTLSYEWTVEQTDKPCVGNGHFSKLRERN
jgi:hypothetical protein